MKKTYLLFIFSLLLMVGCKDSFLDTQNLTQKSSSNYPATPQEADQAVTGAYSVLPGMGAMSNIVMLSELMGDDRFGGGGMNDRDPQAISYFRVVNMNETATTWSKYYQGIFRCNALLSSLPLVTNWESAAQRQKTFGEASFLRGYFYFDLARLYGQVPIVTDPLPANNPKATPDELYAQIAQDLKYAIDSLPATPLTPSWKATNLGRTSKYAAEGIMARAFLFYTGYYKKSEMPLPKGGKITKQQVVSWVDDCIANSGASLVSDFRNLWPYSINEATNYGYALNNKLNWVGDGSSESIFEIAYTVLTTNNWGQNNFYNNTLDLFWGQRNPTAQLPFGHGWGFGPVNPNFYAKWDINDIRRQGSIWKVDDASEGTDGYVWGSDMQWNETGLYGKKYIPININYNGS
ncbi:MAG: RagB/SusD family nutrient uptake outer membrane protein, partial [Marinilabiliales bacterium]|nr:RagB/SusD family nutrient uptake outer membrane protein [Marinilabiliales bacterium]